MRGLVPVNNPNTIYLVIKHGCLCQESKIMREGYDPIELIDRDTHEPYFRYIKPWGGVEAMIVDIKFRSEVYGGIPYNSWKIIMRANPGDPDIVLDLPLNSNVGDRFMKTAEQIDYTRPVEFRVWQEKETKKTAFFIGQREHETDDKAQTVPQLYTKDNLGDCPPARQKFDKTWDFEAQKEFLYQRMMEVVIPRVHAANGTKPEAAIEPGADPFSKSAEVEPSRSEPASAPAPGVDPFAPRQAAPAPAPAPQGVAQGSTGPITDATIALLAEAAGKNSALPPFNEIAQKLYQKPGVRDLTDGQGIALLRYIEML